MKKIAVIEADYTTAHFLNQYYVKRRALVAYLDDWRSLVRYVRFLNYKKRANHAK